MTYGDALVIPGALVHGKLRVTTFLGFDAETVKLKENDHLSFRKNNMKFN